MEVKMKWNYCNNCRQDTKHNVLYSKEKPSGSDDYHWSEFYEVVECNGCETVSFRQEYHDYENRYLNQWGEEDYDVTVTTYPQGLKSHRSLRSTYQLPEKIRTVYSETIMAFKAKSYLLAGVGFRAIIEAICIEEKIKGSNLEQRIDNLAKNRLITEKEAERLHSIRFLGNDSVHEMEVPTEKRLYIVLDIVEHLLQNIYLIDKEAKSVLDTIIREYEDFEELVWQCVRKIGKGEEKSMKELIGKHVRRLGTNLPTFEATLISRISNGDIDFMILGSVKPTTTNPANQQHYLKK